jgi:hypothetical protein
LPCRRGFARNVRSLCPKYKSPHCFKRSRTVSKDKDKRAFDVRQRRTLVVLVNYEKAFELCREALLSLERGKIKTKDLQNGTIHGVNALDWKTFWKNKFWGTIDFNLKKINENLTEIEISIDPMMQTMIVSNGQSWKIAEDLCDYLREKDAEINQKVLVDSTMILEDIYVKPFHKEKVER